jgi:hypothetical protein
MAETQRTVADVYILLGDNISNDISAEDLRDGFETWRMGHGQIYVDPADAAAITISDTTSYFEANAPVWTFSAGAHNFAETQNGRLYYTGVAPVVCHVAFSFSFTAASNNQLIHWRIGKNGTSDVASEIQRQVGTGADVGSSAAHLITTMSNGDYLSVFVRNETGSNNVTLESANLQVVTMPT